MSVGDGLTMEPIPLISAPIVAARIINVHLTAFDSLLLHGSVFSSQLDLLFSLCHTSSLCCILTVKPQTDEERRRSRGNIRQEA